MAHQSTPELLVLHAARIQGYTTPELTAARFGLDQAGVEELMLDEEAYGRIRKHSFLSETTWSLTETGFAEDERRLAAELDATGLRPLVMTVFRGFEPVNAEVMEAMTDWQVRHRGEVTLMNDHIDDRYDRRVMARLQDAGRKIRMIMTPLEEHMTRFAGYHGRFNAALDEAAVDRRRVDAPDRESAHIVWMELHEDFLSTLGRRR